MQSPACKLQLKIVKVGVFGLNYARVRLAEILIARIVKGSSREVKWQVVGTQS